MPFSTATGTELGLTGIGIVPYSTRFAVQTLDPIQQASANIYMDVNGILRKSGGTQFQKYKSTIQCTDRRPFANDGIWPGKLVTVKCISMLSYLTSGGSPARTVVSGSSFTEGAWTFYCPELEMMVTGYTASSDEWADQVTWSMTLQEV